MTPEEVNRVQGSEVQIPDQEDGEPARSKVVAFRRQA